MSKGLVDPKYLDPAVNPMLPGSTAPAFEEKAEEPDKHLDPAHNPLIAVDAAENPPEPGPLTAKILSAFPDETEIEIAGRKLVKMADGSLQLDGKLLAEAPLEVLGAISAALGKKT